MPGAFVRLAPTEITPGTAGSYQTVDVNSYGVPANAVGVLLHVTNLNESLARDVAAREYGSTDTFQESREVTEYYYGGTIVCGIDANGLIEVWTEATTSGKVYLLGYFTSPFAFFVNAVDVSTGSAGTWQDVDCTASCGASATAVLLTIVGGSGAAATRKNGSSDDHGAYMYTSYGNHRFRLVGLDADDIFEQKIGTTSMDVWIQGYYAGTKLTTPDNKTSRTTSSTGSYVDVTALPSGALYGVYEFQNHSTSIIYFGYVRKKGETDDRYSYTNHMARGCTNWFVEGDANRVVQQKIESSNMDLFETGYGEAEPGWAGTFCGISSPSTAVGVIPSSVEGV